MTEQKTRTLVEGFSDWTEAFKSEVVLSRPGGELIISIRAVSDGERMDITEIHRELTPPRPNLSIDRKTQLPRNTPQNTQAELEYEKKKNFAYRVLQMLYIEKGCSWKIPGKNYEEQVDALGKKVAGEVDRLHSEILKLSKLTNEDVDLF